MGAYSHPFPSKTRAFPLGQGESRGGRGECEENFFEEIFMEAKKSLGQNFLRDEEVVEKIISAISAREGEVIVEVGPGEGALTEALAKSGARVIAIELDDRLIPILKEKFRDYPNVEIVHQNVLDADMCNIPTTNNQQPTTYRVVGNLPYYITSAIVRKFLESECSPDEMFFMVQKEVGERICARPGKMSVLAVSVQYYADPELLFVVPKESFDPVPKVESAFIRIANKTENGEQKMDNRRIAHDPRPTTHDKKGAIDDSRLATNEQNQGGSHIQTSNFQLQNSPTLPPTPYHLPPDRKEFFRVVKIGFSARRKTLVNNLSNGFHLEKSVVEKLLESVGIPIKARAQDLSVEDWKTLDKKMKTALKGGEGGV